MLRAYVIDACFCGLRTWYSTPSGPIRWRIAALRNPFVRSTTMARDVAWMFATHSSCASASTRMRTHRSSIAGYVSLRRVGHHCSHMLSGVGRSTTKVHTYFFFLRRMYFCCEKAVLVLNVALDWTSLSTMPRTPSVCFMRSISSCVRFCAALWASSRWRLSLPAMSASTSASSRSCDVGPRYGTRRRRRSSTSYMMPHGWPMRLPMSTLATLPSFIFMPGLSVSMRWRSPPVIMTESPSLSTSAGSKSAGAAGDCGSPAGGGVGDAEAMFAR
mmetsp:Transcript_24476/g.75789  ORF Transcript_24476/g.75789 Transcript_24476/m.75789 type:complete len:273 (-) Transcript_24476:24-842(-)